MKIRNGFVSNSSSSSFIIAVPNKATECKCCKRSNHWLLQAISTYLGTFTKDGNKFYPIQGTDQVYEHFKRELDDLTSSKTYTKERLKVIASLQKNPKVYEDYERLRKELDRARSKMSISAESAIYQGTDADKAKNDLQSRKEQLERYLSDYDKKLKEIEDIIAKVKKFLKKDYTIYSFTIDNWSTEAERAIKEMMREPGLIEVIHSIHT